MAMKRLADLQRLAGATLRPSAPEMAAHAGLAGLQPLRPWSLEYSWFYRAELR